jgi:Tol biopolymer transport system component
MLRRHHILSALLIALAVAPAALAADSYQPGATLLVSRPDGFGPLPAQADGNSGNSAQSISADGRFTAFESNADDLAGFSSDVLHAFVRDDQTGAVTLLDRAGPGGAIADAWVNGVAISADGSTVCFDSYASNLVAGTGSAHRHVYVVKVATGAIKLADRATGGAISDGDAQRCSIDSDGNTVAFEARADNLGIADGQTHVYVRHLGASTTQLADSYQGTAGTGSAYDAAIDAGGTTVAFQSTATNLNGPGGDANGNPDVYARALGAAQPVLVSRANGAAGAIGNGSSGEPSISSNGSLVAFSTNAANLGDGDSDAGGDVHVRNLGTGTTVLASRADGAAGAKGDADSSSPAIAGDGSAVAFISAAANLGADPGKTDEGNNRLAYLRTLGGGHTSVISRASGASGATPQTYTPRVSLDEHAANAVFTSGGALFDPLGNGAFDEVYQRHLGGAFETRLISRPADASGRPGPLGAVAASDHAVSADGRFVTFTAVMDPGANGMEQVYVRDVLLGTTRLVSRAGGADGAMGDGASGDAAISADGTKVAFVSYAHNLGGAAVPDGMGDLVNNTTTLASEGAGGPADNGAGSPALNQDGTRVAFASYSTNLVAGDANGETDVFLRDLTAGTTTRVSLTASGGETDTGSSDPMISADGTRVGFESYAKNMGFGGPDDGTGHVYLRDLAAGTTTLVDRAADGSPGTASVQSPAMSADGNRFVFASEKLTPESTNTNNDTYVRDVAAATTTLASIGPGGEHSSSQVFPYGISMDGTKVAFDTYDGAFGTGEQGGGWLRDLGAGTTQRVGVHDGTQVPADHSFQSVSLDGDGNCVVFESYDGSLASPAYAGRDISQLWMHVAGGECPVHAPDTTITSGPDGKAKVRETYSVFAYKADESGATFTCSLDDRPMAPCGDTFHTGALRDGVHRFKVAATDRAGHIDPTPALVTFKVGVPPRVTKLHLDRRGRLVFKLSEKAKVRVGLVRAGKAHSAAVGKLTLKRSFKKGTRHVKLPRNRLRSGHYHATVTATDAGGNRSVPKRKSFDVRH